MTVFKIQAYLAAVSDYDNVLTISPDYVWSVAKVWRRWWFPWPRIEVGVVKNLRPAEMKALKMVLHQARVRRKKDKTRILRVTQLNGKETKTVIWDNGTVLDPMIWPWYWRLIRWLFGRLFDRKKPIAKTQNKGPEKK